MESTLYVVLMDPSSLPIMVNLHVNSTEVRLSWETHLEAPLKVILENLWVLDGSSSVTPGWLTSKPQGSTSPCLPALDSVAHQPAQISNMASGNETQALVHSQHFAN